VEIELAEHDDAGLFQELYGAGVFVRDVVFSELRARGGDDAGGLVEVLDGEPAIARELALRGPPVEAESVAQYNY
jgi:hypothetical protein